MTYLAFRNLFQQKFRLALSIAGVALAMTLIVLLNGFLAGIYVQVTAYLDHTPADLIVAQDGVTNLLSATSLLPASTEDLARGVERVREYGVLKAVGAKNRHLYWLVTQQGLFTALVGAGLGIGLAWLVGQWVMAVSPKFLVIIQIDSTLTILLTGVIMGLLAALLPARYVGGLDPARVFRK